jgi:hypothetical protein
VRFRHAEALRADLQEAGLAPATVNRHLAALRGVPRAAFRLGMISAQDHARARDVESVRVHRLPAGRAL